MNQLQMGLAKLAASCFLIFALAACAAFGTPAPQSFNQRLVAGYTTVEAVANTATQLRAAGKLSDADKDNVVSTSRTALAGLDLAAQVHKTNPAAGQDKLTATITVLTALQAYLLTKESK
jgi:type II secretory pathway component PulM